MRYNYTDEDMKFLEENYPNGNWDEILNRFSQVSYQSICKKACRMGLSCESRRYGGKRKEYDFWSTNEINCLKENYSISPMEEVEKLLPNRTKNAIILKANNLGILSFIKLNENWKESELEYIKDNWELVPDILMAKKLSRTQRAVKWKREELGCYRRGMDLEQKSYPTLSKYIRGHNHQWKQESIKACNYQCVLTSSKDFEIHHLYGVSNIIKTILKTNHDLEKDDFEDYTQEELDLLTELFLIEQAKYPLGECVNKELHVLFHSSYGQYYNTPEQWYRFKEDYNNGEYIKTD